MAGHYGGPHKWPVHVTVWRYLTIASTPFKQAVATLSLLGVGMIGDVPSQWDAGKAVMTKVKIGD